jgi:flagellar motor switch protein FliN/FliY
MTDEDKPIDDDALADEWAAALEEQDVPEDEAGVQAAPLESLKESGMPMSAENSPNMDVILDIPVTLAMEVGSTNISIRNLLQLNVLRSWVDAK